MKLVIENNTAELNNEIKRLIVIRNNLNDELVKRLNKNKEELITSKTPLDLILVFRDEYLKTLINSSLTLLIVHYY